jgi:uncharacterized repeat protein (TIGR03803 family)
MNRTESICNAFAAAAILTAALTACGGPAAPPSNRLSEPMAAAQPRPTHTPEYKLLYTFKGTPDGAFPFSGLIEKDSDFYGTTRNGSKNYCSQNCGSNDCHLGCGTIFRVDKSGREEVVYNFQGTFNDAHDGSLPYDSLTATRYYGLLGTTSSGGTYGNGTIFRLHGSDEEVLHSFAGGEHGGIPKAALTPPFRDIYLWGTTIHGGGTGCGGKGCGVVFETSISGNARIIYRFRGGEDGYYPEAGLVEYHQMFYGTTIFGGSGCGSDGCGTVYRVGLGGTYQVLYEFAGGDDGAHPNGLVEHNGIFYGTTKAGGSSNTGTVFSITPAGEKKTLYSFKPIPDGNFPGASLVVVYGFLVGTTVGGGTSGNGTVFRVSPISGKESLLYSFQGGNDGSDPRGALLFFDRWLYGTTTRGGGRRCGGQGCGTVFRLEP